MRIFAAAVLFFLLTLTCSTASWAQKISGFDTWLGPTAEDMAESYHNGTFIPPLKNYGWFGPNQEEMTEEYNKRPSSTPNRDYRLLNRDNDSPFPRQ